MILNIYTIYDTATGAYLRPFYAQSDGQAMRGFQDICNDATHEIAKHPEDYSLCRIGRFNDNKGRIEPEDVEVLATALEMVAKSRQITPGSLKQEDFLGESDAQVGDEPQLQ
jgi:heterodisulfide reductase subunit A-like polyferredoxin